MSDDRDPSAMIVVLCYARTTSEATTGGFDWKEALDLAPWAKESPLGRLIATRTPRQMI